VQLAKRQLAVAVASALFQPGFVWDLSKGSIVPARGATWANVTHTRATIGTFDDQDSMVRTALSGEARFRGLRRVQNLFTFTEDFSNGVWVSGDAANPILPNTSDIAAPDGSFTACKWVLNSNALNRSFGYTSVATSALPGRTYTFSFWVYVPSTNSANTWKSYMFSGGEIPGDWTDLNALPRNQWVRARYTHTWGAGAASNIIPQFHQNAAETIGDRIYVWRPQLEEVTAQSVQHPGEYNSVSKLAAPYQGANIDGVQYFPTHNGNVVQQNLILQSQSFDSAAWTKRGVSAVTADATAAPDGTLTADLISGLGTLGVDDVFQTLALSGVVAGLSRFEPSVYLKKVSSTGTLTVYNPGNAANGRWDIDLSKLSTGWERITRAHSAVTVVVEFTPSPALAVGLHFVGTAGAPLSVYAWGAQIQPGRRSGTYVATTAAAVNNNIVEESVGDTIAGNPGYFREDGRVNLFLRSDNFSATWVLTDTTNNPDVAISPDGSINADRLDEGVLGTAQTVQAVTGTANANYAISGWFKKNINNDWIQLGAFNGANSFRAWFNLNTGVKGNTGVGGTGAIVTSAIVAYPNGWYRCIVAGSVGSAATAITGFFSSTSADNVTTRVNNASYFAWGQQFEDNQSWPSSYLPTTIATVTRNTDVLLCSGLGAYFTADASWYAEVISDQTVLSNPRVIGVTGVKGVLAHNSSVPIAGPGSYGASLWDNAVATSSVNTVNTGVLAKMCSKYTVGVNAAKAGLNGGAMVAGNTNAFSGETTIGVGTTNAGGATGFYGVIRKIHGWQRQIPDAYMQRITA
jgi:hypothetical protein